MPAPLLSVQNLGHRYRHRAELVLRDVSFDVGAGEAVAVVGRSGCGKSTLLHLIAGLAQPTAGTVHIHGEPVRKPSARWVVMFQQPLLYPWMTAFENTALGPRFAGRRREAPKLVGDLLALVNMADYAGTNVQRLSGGQQQRIALARSLAAQPEILMLDEPFSALDTFTRRALQVEVRAIAKRLGITLLLVTHDIDEAVLMADRALVMDARPGRIRADLAFHHLPDERAIDDPAVQFERGRLLAALGETTQAPQPGDFHQI
ncbi:ABC transporter ATP-binding protein [Azospirillum doebereinerae]|uniref:ABC transporter ATP-binding protein n=1 Tax=Azospirillum doebereinerae TaxID=92933 RepID=A0A3S0XLD6_9PROT|nr:ABC transporter ATP-binding protein [Azospirillum doebereinerae]RUQ68123.1 ABC transporter ATP-binding protein [Azospirillum doebereinerae]